MNDQKLRKKTFSMRSVRRDHVLNEIVHFIFISITANKIHFCFQMPQASTLSFLHWNEGSKTKNPYFSAYYFSVIIFNSSL